MAVAGGGTGVSRRLVAGRASHLAVLASGSERGYSLSGSCGLSYGSGSCEVSGLQWDAHDHLLTRGHADMARALRWDTGGEQRKVAPNQRVRGVCDLDLGHVRLRWVVEGGMKVMARLTRETMSS